MADPKKIFIVEDDTDLASMLVDYFRSLFYDVRAANWGEDAVQQISADVPDVVLLDIRLPDIDGYEVCRRLRQTRHTQNLPIIFLTERRERDFRLAGLELGAVDYITKPFDISELRLRMRNVLRRSTMNSYQNAVTGLPEGNAVEEELQKLPGEADWAVLVLGIHGLSLFRDQYGFVAADDVTRAISLMITNAMQENGSQDDFVGHLTPSDLIVITTPERCRKLTSRCRMRLEPSIQYFYPAMDRQRVNRLPASERLSVEIGCLQAQDYPAGDVAGLKSALTRLFD